MCDQNYLKKLKSEFISYPLDDKDLLHHTDILKKYQTNPLFFDIQYDKDKYEISVNYFKTHAKHIDCDGKSLLYKYCEKGLLYIIKILVSNGASINPMYRKYIPLHIAISEKNFDLVKFLVSEGADVNVKSLPDFEVPLYISVKKNCFDITKFLIDNGADVNRRCCFYKYPILATACMFSSIEIIGLLLDNGAKINLTTKEGETPIRYMASRSSIPIYTFLIEKGADINLPNIFGETITYAALDLRYWDVFDFFVSKGGICEKIKYIDKENYDTCLKILKKHKLGKDADKYFKVFVY